jgi:hypothetical protein
MRELMLDLAAEGCHWVSNEAPGIFPAISGAAPPPTPRLFELALDGHVVAHTHGHGRTLRWL